MKVGRAQRASYLAEKKPVFLPYMQQAFPDRTWVKGGGGGIPAGQSQCTGTSSFNGKQNRAWVRLWRRTKLAGRRSKLPHPLAPWLLSASLWTEMETGELGSGHGLMAVPEPTPGGPVPRPGNRPNTWAALTQFRGPECAWSTVSLCFTNAYLTLLLLPAWAVLAMTSSQQVQAGTGTTAGSPPSPPATPTCTARWRRFQSQALLRRPPREHCRLRVAHQTPRGSSVLSRPFLSVLHSTAQVIFQKQRHCDSSFAFLPTARGMKAASAGSLLPAPGPVCGPVPLPESPVSTPGASPWDAPLGSTVLG